jgi:hypothetical protein
MAIGAGVERRPQTAAFAWRISAPLAVAIVLGLLIPLLSASPAHLTSDESLYLAEAYNIAHGEGATYPSGEPITHRAPLFPLVLAPAVKVGGPDAAYTVAKLFVAANALLVLLLAWRMGGSFAGVIAGGAAAASSYLNGLATTLYLDPAQCTALLGALLFLHRALDDVRPRWFVAAGLCTGVAFLFKESAVQWAPLGVIAWLAMPQLRSRVGARGALAFTLAFGGIAGLWPLWVAARASETFLLGSSGAMLALLALAAIGITSFATGIAAWRSVPEHMRERVERMAPAAAKVIVLAWAVFMLYGLTRYATWDYPNDYAANVPAYLRSVAPQAQPFFLLALAWVWCVRAAHRGQPAYRLIAVAAALFAPFALFIANRNLQLRDALPLVYLSYLVLGLAVADAVRAITRRPLEPPARVFALSAALGLTAVFVMHQAIDFRRDNAEASAASRELRPDAWENPFALSIADWMSANLPEGARVLTSRLYFSSLHVRTESRFEIRQIPTVRVDIKPGNGSLLSRESNLFRWGDAELRSGGSAGPREHWLYLKQFPGKGYWIGLSQDELLGYIDEHALEYVLLTGDDSTFSSLAYADYFTGHPAFTLVHAEGVSASDRVFVYAIDRTQLALKPHSTVITPSSASALAAETRLDRAALEADLGSRLRITDLERGLSERELFAAMVGVDLGLP